MATIIETAGGLAVVRTCDQGTFHIVRVYGNEEVQSLSSRAFAEFSDDGIRHVTNGGSYQGEAAAVKALRRLAAKQGDGR